MSKFNLPHIYFVYLFFPAISLQYRFILRRASFAVDLNTSTRVVTNNVTNNVHGDRPPALKSGRGRHARSKDLILQSNKRLQTARPPAAIRNLTTRNTLRILRFYSPYAPAPHPQYTIGIISPGSPPFSSLVLSLRYINIQHQTRMNASSALRQSDVWSACSIPP